MSSLSTPDAVQQRLEQIEQDLGQRQLVYEQAALDWFRKKRDREHEWAVAFVKAEGSVEARKAAATIETAMVGKEEEALWESLRAVMRTLETRSTIGMALLKSQGRVEAPSSGLRAAA